MDGERAPPSDQLFRQEEEEEQVVKPLGGSSDPETSQADKDRSGKKQSQLTSKPLVQASKQRLENACRENSKPSGPMRLELARQTGFDRDVVGSLIMFSPQT